MLLGYLQKFALAAISRAHREVGLCLDDKHRILGVPVIQLGESKCEQTQYLVGSPFNGVHDVVSRICIPLIYYVSHSGCCSPTHSPLPSHTVYDSVLWMKQERNRPLSQHTTQMGMLGIYTQALTFSCGRNHLAQSCAALGRCNVD